MHFSSAILPFGKINRGKLAYRCGQDIKRAVCCGILCSLTSTSQLVTVLIASALSSWQVINVTGALRFSRLPFRQLHSPASCRTMGQPCTSILESILAQMYALIAGRLQSKQAPRLCVAPSSTCNARALIMSGDCTQAHKFDVTVHYCRYNCLVGATQNRSEL